MIKETLEELGLSRRESLCYLALLELGSCKSGAIVKKTGIPSSKIYEILDRLVKRGLASYVFRGKIKHFQAADPKVLLSYIDEKRKKVLEILPQLQLKQKFAKKQKVEMFEGQKAIFALYTNLIHSAKSRELYLVFSINEENKSKSAQLFFKNLAVRRKEKRLDVRLLKNSRHYKKERHTKMKMRFTRFNLPQGITVFRNTVVLLSWEDAPTAVKIDSHVFAAQLRGFFLEMWKRAEPQKT